MNAEAQPEKFQFSCPHCPSDAKSLRVPKNRGLLKVKCPNGHQFHLDTKKAEWWAIDEKRGFFGTEKIKKEPAQSTSLSIFFVSVLGLLFFVGFPLWLFGFFLNGAGLLWPVVKIGGGIFAAWLALTMLLEWMKSHDAQPTTAFAPRGSGEFGDAGFATIDDLTQFAKRNFNLFTPTSEEFAKGVYLQQFVEAFSPEGKYRKEPEHQRETGEHLTYRSENQLITVAPPGEGKGTCAIIPTLLGCDESAFVLDVKGELFKETAAFRKNRRGHRIIRINPFNMEGAGTNRFNPLAILNPKDETACALGIAAISEALIKFDGDKGSFFTNRARSFMNAVLGFIVWDEHRKGKTATLPMLSKVLHLDNKTLSDWLAAAAQVCPFLIVKENALTFIGDGNMIQSVKASALEGLEFLKLPAVVDFLSGHDFSFRDLRTQKATIYLMIPLNQLNFMAFFMRLIVRLGFSDLEHIEDKHKNRVLMILDECAKLGYMEKIESAYSINRGYSLRVWSIFQNLQQMQITYPKEWSSMLSSCDIAQFFTPNDSITAEWLSKTIGNSTVTSTSENSGFSQNVDGQGRPTSGQNQGSSTGKKEKIFLSPQDLRGLPKNRGLLIVRGLQYPVLTTRTPYFSPDSPFYKLTD